MNARTSRACSTRCTGSPSSERPPAAALLRARSRLSRGAAPAQSPPKPIEFRSQVEAVYVDVFVTRSGKPYPASAHPTSSFATTA